MQMIYTAPNVIPCDLLTSVLEAAGIPCMVRNPGGSWALGEGLPLGNSLAWAWPEVWVNDEDCEVATGIVAQFRNGESSEGPLAP